MYPNKVLGTIMALVFLTTLSNHCSGTTGNGKQATGREVAVPRKSKGRAEIMEDKKIALSYSDFGIEMIKTISKTESGNILLSPVSVAIALSMTANGAEGETFDSITKTLKIPDIDLDRINSSNREMINILSSLDGGIELNIANSIWCRKGLNFKDRFIDANTRYYSSKVESIDFSSSEAKDKINNWVKEKTKGKIPKIIDRIKPSDILFLINAIYFKGRWAKPFDAELTSEEPFHTADGGETAVPMMRRSGTYPYLESDDFQAVMLPYTGKRIAMIIFLPAKGHTIDEFIAGTDARELSGWIKKIHPRRGKVIIPRYSFEFAASLKDVLSELGMAIAFDPSRADLSEMIEVKGENAFISDVIHKTYIDVSEEGTEAAAATGVQVGLTAVQVEEKPFVFKADRPFFFIIRDNRSGLILFEGVVKNPTE